jgi:SAM-dependent methyltransferase
LLKTLLTHPLVRDRDLDDPATTSVKRRLVREKAFLRRIYDEWYAIIIGALPPGHKPVLELGSGPGFFAERHNGVIASEIFSCPGVQVVLDGGRLPFAEGSLGAIVMTDVFHHLPDVAAFFREATTCVAPGGRIVMIEPWTTTWSRLIYSHFHHEPFDPGARDWALPPGGPMSGANGALPWIVFERDREVFEQVFPRWRIGSIKPFMPFRYLVSGGVSMRSLMPGAAFPAWRGFEALLQPWARSLAMFALIVVDRVR